MQHCSPKTCSVTSAGRRRPVAHQPVAKLRLLSEELKLPSRRRDVPSRRHGDYWRAIILGGGSAVGLALPRGC